LNGLERFGRKVVSCLSELGHVHGEVAILRPRSARKEKNET
jgi:hypothetical protein